MDFTNRSAQPQSFQPGQAPGSPAASAPAPSHKKDKRDDKEKRSMPGWYRGVSTILLVVVALLVLSLTALTLTSRPETQDKFVDSNKLQAVFLNSGQVYFGHITGINNQYYVLDNIYYLQSSNTNTNTTQQSSDSNISLVKLGCELHQPYDRMVINHDQVTFWENLKSDGQVAKAVKEFQDKNPNGQTCSNTAAPTTNNVQGGANTQNTTNTNTNNSTSTTKKP